MAHAHAPDAGGWKGTLVKGSLMGILDLGRYRGIVFAITGFLVFVAVILAVNHGQAARFAGNVAASRFLAERQVEPRQVHDAGLVVSEQLQSGQDIAAALEALRRAAKTYDDTLAGLVTGAMITNGAGELVVVAGLAEEPARSLLAGGSQVWSEYKARLEPVLRFSGSPYAARGAAMEATAAVPGAAGTAVPLSPRGRRLQTALAELNRYGESAHPQLARVLTQLAAGVERASRAQSQAFRRLQLGGMVAAVLLLAAILLYFARHLRKEEAASSRARKETADILRTVNEGLFLLDKDLKLGSERSLALSAILRREDFTGVSFDELLRGIVPEKTLRTAMDYVSLLWGERVNEKLVKTINPLNEVEVHFDNPAGGFDTHFLEFDFNRVKSDGSLSHLLVTVNDVTKRVMLSRELQESQEKAQAQLDLLLRVLHVPPESLTAFLSDADVSLRMVNSILKEPAREEAAFRVKIDGIYRQIHALKGEAAALGLKTVEQRAHAFEEALDDLKSRPALSGSDFLPLVVKLDDLFNHLAQVREMLGRLVDLHQAISSRSAADGEMAAEKVDDWLAGRSEPATPDAGAHSIDAPVAPVIEASEAALIERTLEDLALRVAASQSKQVALRCSGLDAVPEPYRRAVKDIAIQLVRNAVVHGIERPEERTFAHKGETGALSVEFTARDDDGYELIVQDDGRGLQLDRIKQVAIERGLITPAQAALLDARQTMALIFRPGFSTAERVTTDAGRGAGMDLVRILVAELGGRVGLASGGGKFAKFKIWLPALERAAVA